MFSGLHAACRPYFSHPLDCLQPFLKNNQIRIFLQATSPKLTSLVYLRFLQMAQTHFQISGPGDHWMCVLFEQGNADNTSQELITSHYLMTLYR